MADTVSVPDEPEGIDRWIRTQDFRSTAEIKIPERLVDQVIGQESAVEVIRKAAEQKRHVLLFGILVAGIIWMATRYTGHRQENIMVPKLLVTHSPDELPPFIDATGSHAGALLGDVKHDPFQSGGLETPAHERVEAGAIHKAHKGVLFIDETNLLRMESQQSLLTAMQEKKF